MGIVTACTGHTGPELNIGQTCTRQQCEEMLYKDLVKHANALTDGQRAPFVSFAFNVRNKPSVAAPWCARPIPATLMVCVQS